MTIGAEEPSSPVQPPPLARPNPFQRMAGVFFSPGETMRDVATRPDIIVPLITLVLISVVMTMLIMPHIDFAAEIRANLAGKSNLSSDQSQQAMKFGLAAAKGIAYASPFLVPIGWAVYAGVVLLLFRLFGAEGTFPQAYSVKLYSAFPGVLRSILTAIIVSTKGQIPGREMATVLRSNLGFLINMKTDPALFTLVSSFDVFAIWSLVLGVIGFASMAKVSKARSAAVLVTLFVLFTLVIAGFAALGAKAKA